MSSPMFRSLVLPRREQLGAKQAEHDVGSTVTAKQREFLDFVLDQYVREGVDELDIAQLPPLLKLTYTTRSQMRLTISAMCKRSATYSLVSRSICTDRRDRPPRGCSRPKALHFCPRLSRGGIRYVKNTNSARAGLGESQAAIHGGRAKRDFDITCNRRGFPTFITPAWPAS